MTDFNTKDGTNLGPSRIWTSPTAYALYENPIAIAEGAAGAPRIQTAALDTGAVTTPKIAPGAVTEEKTANLAITTNKIGAQAVTPDKISKANIRPTATLVGNETSTIPAGVRYYCPHSSIDVEVNIGGTWVQGAFGLVISDGINFRLRNKDTVSNTISLVRYE